MLVDSRSTYLAPVRSVMADIVAPFQFVVSSPVQVFDVVNNDINSYTQLVRENNSLRQQQLILQAKLQRFAALEHQNQQLNAALKIASNNPQVKSVARVLAVSSSVNDQQIVLAKGTQQGVKTGQVAIDGFGVMGQVVQTNLLTSQVMLLTDRHSAVPVIDNHSGAQLIVVGQGDSPFLTLQHVPVTTKIKVGDLLVTSGLGQRYPAGYPVGKVVSVNNQPGEQYLQVSVMPVAHLNGTQTVVLVDAGGENGQT